MKFWYGSGSADPYLWLMDPDSDPDQYADPDPVIFVSDIKGFNKKLIFYIRFVAYYQAIIAKHASKKFPTNGYCGEQITNPSVLKVTCWRILRRTIHKSLRVKSYLLTDIAANNPQNLAS
jgi:hypothetical protein